MDLKVYKCQLCGTTVEVLNGSGASLTCCGEKMIEVVANSTDAATEKHVPFIEKFGDDIVVRVGEIAHPMEAEHYIMWVAMVCEWSITKVSLKPLDNPEVRFKYVPGSTIYAYCNKHGLWKKVVE